MRIATAPVNWNSPDVPEYRAWLPYPQMMDEFVEAGYDATEWGPGMPEDPAELKAALDARGLDMVGAFVGLGFRDADRHDAEMAKAMEIARRLHATGGKLLIAAEARRRPPARPRPATWTRRTASPTSSGGTSAEGLHDLADNLEPLGMRVVFHNHVGTYVETPARDRPAARRDGPREGGLVPGHRPPRLRRRQQPRDARHLRRPGAATSTSRTSTARCSRRRRPASGASGTALKAYIFPTLGEGIAQVPEMVEALLGRGYDGWFVLEQDTCRGEPKDVARVNREYLEGLLARVATG